ncbi:MAG: DUF1566 domain-containing protein [Holophagales bacterium]|nr:DUF1566 domain-containing protein [Holophagales bacterium]
MRGSRCWTRAVLGGAVALVALGLAEEAVYCQTVPPPKPKPKPKTRTATPSQPAPQPAAARAFLLIDADAPCTVEVNGEGKGQAGGGKTLKVSVELGQNVVKAINLDAGVAWRKVIEVEGAGQKVVTVELANSIEREQERREIAHLEEKGGWVDPSTGLMWAMKDNGRNVDWNAAFRYCDAFRAGEYSDWRLPNVEELKGLYDSSRWVTTKSSGPDLDRLLPMA